MGLLRNKESSDPVIIIDNCLKTITNRISDDLDGESYHWNKPWGVKRFESIVLAKFLMDLAFNHLSEDKLQDDEKTGFENLCNTSFSTLFNDEFSSVDLVLKICRKKFKQRLLGISNPDAKTGFLYAGMLFISRLFEAVLKKR